MSGITFSTPNRIRSGLFVMCLVTGTLAVTSSQPAHAATITVDGASCNLADAITAANTDNAVGGCQAGSGADTIELQPNAVYELTAVDNTVAGASRFDGIGPNGLPVVTSEIVIAANGATIQRSDSAPSMRIVMVAATGDLTLLDLTIRNGLAVGAGGGIFNDGNLTLSSTTVRDSRSSGELGGGIFNGPNGTLALTESTVAFNYSGRDGDGGGILNYYGTADIDRSLIEGNNSGLDGSGGGISNASGTLTITNSTLLDNNLGRSGVGGAIVTYGVGSVVAVTNSTFTGNGACCDPGGGAYGQRGGAIWARDGLVTLDHITMVGNRVNENTVVFSAGVHIEPSATVRVRNSIIAGNVTSGQPGVTPDEPSDVFGVVVSEGYNVIGNDDWSSGWVPTDLIGPVGSLVEPLASHGGPTETMALPAGSPAIDFVPAGTNGCGTSITADQRGVARPQGSACDAGAYEVDDRDGDGVVDVEDACPGTVLPDDEPPQLKKNRFYTDADGDFVDVNGDSAGISVIDTGGCSAGQIVDRAGLGRGHVRFGITKSALTEWIATLGVPA